MKIPTVFRTGVFQLTLIYIVLFGISVATIFVFVYWSTIDYLEEQSDEVIRVEIQGLAEQANRAGLTGLIDVINERVRRDEEGRAVYLLTNQNLRPLAGNVAFWPRQFNTRGEWVNFIKTDALGNQAPARALVLEVGTGYRLLVGREITELEQTNQLFQRTSLWGMGLTITLALSGGLLMARSAQRRIARLNRTTRSIIAGNLSERVPTTGAHDEYGELANNVNAMLDQIENLLLGIRHVGDSIAHDLRGPLTRLRNRIEILANEETPSRDSLVECTRQADALLDTFSALLRIARVESGVYRSAFARVDMSEIVTDVCDLYQAAAEERQIRLFQNSPTGVFVFGDRELLAQALTNVLDNAMKHTPDGGHIEVSLEERIAGVTLRVADSGPGIPESEHERVVERFARLDQARSLPGNGLGLALVNAVAQQHGGKLSFGDNRPGLVVKMDLPTSSG
jgi:signal transduction histidine kinase